MDINEKLKVAIEGIKARAEEMKFQLNLGVIEAQDEFERQKKNIEEWITENDISVENFKSLTEEQKEELKSKLEELRLQLALGRADGEDLLKEQYEKLNRTIHEIKVKIEKDDFYKDLKSRVRK